MNASVSVCRLRKTAQRDDDELPIIIRSKSLTGTALWSIITSLDVRALSISLVTSVLVLSSTLN
jgi:hypothetical protein